jgi:hypothetical protein
MPLDLFTKTKIPHILPKEMNTVINDLKKSKNKDGCK